MKNVNKKALIKVLKGLEDNQKKIKKYVGTVIYLRKVRVEISSLVVLYVTEATKWTKDSPKKPS